MFLVFQIFFILYGLYCFTFCSIVIYTTIIEEWCCPNRIPYWIKNIRRDYQPINEELEVSIV